MMVVRPGLPGRWARVCLSVLVCALPPGVAWADGVDMLRSFARDVKSARAAFSQTVISPDGNRRKTSSGQFEFSRPDRFRFSYERPFEQTIVADGQTLWLHDAELNQVVVRPYAQAMGATPAALLAGHALERDFALSALPARDGLDWVQAQPRQADGQIRSLQVGFRDGVLAALEVTDAFGQRSLLQFSDLKLNPRLGDDRFRYEVPAGVEVLRQPY
ncbi:MAG: outer membrane lipoprotein chaperone LolA [Aquabacterium sp.]|nr:outer membrane lipoprotein chaperone LolA [Aquabacterium sp.]